jgi:flagellar protein FliT
MPSDLQRLDSILADTEKLIQLAQEGEWDAVVKLEKARDTDIQHLFETPPDIEAVVLAESIQLVLDKNKILTQFLLSQRDSLRMEMSQAGHAHKAINAYLTTG